MIVGISDLHRPHDLKAQVLADTDIQQQLSLGFALILFILKSGRYSMQHESHQFRHAKFMQ